MNKIVYILQYKGKLFDGSSIWNDWQQFQKLAEAQIQLKINRMAHPNQEFRLNIEETKRIILV